VKPIPDLIFFSLEDWDDIWRRNQFVCATLARRHPEMKILFLGLPRNVARHLRARNLAPLVNNPTRTIEGHPNITFTRPLRIGPEATDSALLSLLGGEGEFIDSLLDSSNDYQDAVDQLMAQLG